MLYRACLRAHANHMPRREAETYEQLTLSVRKKKPEVNDKRIYRISRKFIGFAVSLSDKIYKKKLIKLYTII